MKVPALSEDVIQSNAEQGSIERGKEYVASGAVKSLKRRSDTEVEAFVQGTDIAPYRVEITHDPNGITRAECTCPYVSGAWCRHIVATLYAVLDSEGFLSRPVDEMLAEFDRSELIMLIEKMLAVHPECADTLEDAFRQKEAG